MTGVARRSGTSWQVVVWVTETGEERWKGERDSEDAACEILREQVGTKPTKKPDGEPSLDRYVQRCEEWAMAVGDYADKAEERRANPPVLMSFTHNVQSDVAKRARGNAVNITRWLHELSVSQKPGDQWMMSDEGMWEWGHPTAYAPFYVTPMRRWDELMGVQRLVVHHRNPVAAHVEQPGAVSQEF